ncbi:hypothetical protein FGB62_104g121 [Gracilaria domingensis]|nr:hypothetical protein FGB62_104g121 [Gracilaria domingensis]
MSIVPQPHTVKQFLFTCPAGDYGFNNLPNQVLSLHAGEREAPAPAALPQIAQPPYAVPNYIDLMLELSPSADSTLPAAEHSNVPSLLDSETASHLPWIIDDTFSLSDNMGIPANPGMADTSSGAFNFGALSQAIRQIEHTLQGKFIGTSENHYPLAMSFESPVDQTIVNIETADALEAKLLRRYAVNVYFEATAPVISDEKFLKLPITASRALLQQSQGGVNGVEPFSASTGARRIAPSPASVCSDKGGVVRTEADLARERMLEARRRRNRLSAARSNEKRKEAWKRSVQTLEELKQRVQHLQSRQQRLMEENGALRERVGHGAASDE